MANTKISNLTASASNLASTDLAPVVQTVGVGPVKMTGLQLAGGLLGSTTFNGSTVTTSSPVLNLTQTWNAGAVTFTGLKFNATDTASASGSLLLDLQVGSSSKVAVGKNGSIALNGGSLNAGEFNTSLTGGLRFGSGINGVFPAGNNVISIITNSTTSATFRETGAIFFTSMGLGTAAANLTADVILTRAAAATLQLGAADAAAPVAQFFKVQSVVGSTPGASDVAGANFTIQGSAGRGSGAGGSIIFQVAPAGSAGTGAQNAYATALTLASSGAATFGGSVTIGTGNISYLSINPTGYTNGIILSNTGSNMDIALVSGGSIHWSENATNAGSGTAANGVWLWRDAANTLALRNGTNAQLFRVYSTYNGTNDAYGAIGAGVKLDGTYASGDENILYIGSQKKGSPTALTKLAIQVDGTTRADYGVTNSATFTFNSRVNVSQSTQCYVSFTAGGVTNYFGTAGATDDVVAGSAAGDAYIRANNKNMLFSTDNGATAALRLNSSGLLQFGGTTSSFPALKRSSATLQVRLADDSAFADIGARGVIYNGVTFANLPGTPTTGTVAYVTDASNASAAWGDSVTAGGSTNKYLVWYNGTNWTVVGK